MDSLVNSLLIMDEPPKPETPAPQETVAQEAGDVAELQEVEAGEDQTETAETDDEATEADDDAPKAPQTFTVKVDGKEVAVTLDELKRGYSGNAYVQKGMQEAADARKTAQALYEAVQTEQAKFLEAYQAVAQQGFKAPPQAPDPKLLDADPIGYMQARARFETEAVEYQTQQAQIQRIAQQQRAMQDRAAAEFVAQQAKELATRIPEFADPVKAKEISAKIRAVASEAYGFNDAELGEVRDARAVAVLHDAMKWRELQKARTLQKQASPAPKAVVPQGRRAEPPQLERKRLLEAAKKSGKAEAFVDFLLK